MNDRRKRIIAYMSAVGCCSAPGAERSEAPACFPYLLSLYGVEYPLHPAYRRLSITIGAVVVLRLHDGDNSVLRFWPKGVDSDVKYWYTVPFMVHRPCFQLRMGRLLPAYSRICVLLDE